MNKQQAYFEKNVVPYRQKIRDLEIENKDIRIDNYNLKAMNSKLLKERNEKEVEIQKLLTLLDMTEEDRKIFLAKEKRMNECMAAVGAMNRIFN